MVSVFTIVFIDSFSFIINWLLVLDCGAIDEPILGTAIFLISTIMVRVNKNYEYVVLKGQIIH